MRKIICFCLLITCFIINGYSQNYQSALNLFMQNNRQDAKQQLQKIDNSSADYLNAQLLLTMAYIEDGHSDSAFYSFRNFYNLHPDPYAYAYGIWNKELFSPDKPQTQNDVKAFMQKIAQDPKTPVTLKSMAVVFLANNSMMANKVSESRKQYNQLNDVRNWATVGTFQNISASGFNKDFGVLAHPEKDYTFTNYSGAPVKWFNIDDARNDRWLDLEYNHSIDNSIVYTQTFLQSDDDKKIKMLLGVSGSVKVWINDFMVFSETEERNTDMDVYTLPVQLNKGYNRILIQLGSSEISRSNFMLRFADNAGNLLPAFPSTQEVKPYTKVTAAYNTKPEPFFAEKYFEDKLANKTATILDKILLVNVYNHNDKAIESRKIAKQLKAEASKSTMISEIVIESYIRDKNNTDLTREEELVKSNDPESLYGLILRYYDAYNKEDYNEAETLLNRNEEIYGVTDETTIKHLYLFNKRKEVESFLKLLDKAYDKYPDNATIVNMKYTIEESVNKNSYKSIGILEKYLKNHFSEDLTEILATAKSKIGKKEESQKLLIHLVEDKPYTTMRYTTIANGYYEIKDYDKAIKWQQKTVEHAPYVGHILDDLASFYEAAGKKQDAIEYYKKAIQYGPHNYEARKKLRKLEGKKELFSYFKENNIAGLFKSSPKQDDYPNDNSIYLLKDYQQIIYPENGASEENYDYLIKIFNQKGIDSWKEVSIPFNSYTQRLIFDKIELFKKDGSKVQAESNENQIVFSSLEVGDAIHISYKLESSSYGKLSEHFWSDFSFNSGLPILLARYSLLVPAGKKFQYKVYNTSMQPEKKEVGDNFTLYTWEDNNNKAIQSESDMPAYTDILKKVVVSSIPDWNYVANWYSDLSNIKAKADFEIKEKVKELMDGNAKLPDLEKARIIYNYIEDNFNYSNVSFLHSALTPQRASRTLNSRLGDCKDLAVLFVAMAKETGLDANLVLVDTRDQGENSLDLPFIGFNHCIAQLNDKGKTYYVELTDNHLPFRSMENVLIKANGLMIPKDGAQTSTASLFKINTPDRTPNLVYRSATLVMEDNKAIISRVSTRVGAETSGSRNGYRNKSEEDKKKDLTKSLSGEFNTPVTLKNFSISNLDNLKDTIVFKYSFEAEKYSSEIAGMQIIKLPWGDAYSNLQFVSLEKRTYPFNLWSFSSTPYDKETITVSLPAGKKWVEIPKNISYSCSSISFTMNYEMKQDKLVVTREVKYLKDQIPVEEYKEFKEIMSKIAEADRKQMAYK